MPTPAIAECQQELLSRLGLSLRGARKHGVDAGRKGDTLGDRLLGLRHECADVAAGHVRRHDPDAAGAVVKKRIASCRRRDMGKLGQRQPSAVAAMQHEGPDELRLPSSRRIQNDCDVEHAIAIIGLSCHAALIGRLNGVEHLHRLESELGQTVRSELDPDFGHTGGGLYLDVDGPRNL